MWNRPKVWVTKVGTAADSRPTKAIIDRRELREEEEREKKKKRWMKPTAMMGMVSQSSRASEWGT
jgi:hypothetical protein